jgi:hypothetical protein
MTNGRFLGRHRCTSAPASMRRMTRDQAALGGRADRPPNDDESVGTHCGSHPAGSTFSQDGDGTLWASDGNGDPLASYPPASYRVVEDGDGMLHVHKTGPWNAEENMRVEPEPTHDTGNPEMMRRMNERNQAHYDRQPLGGSTHDSASDTMSDRAIDLALATPTLLTGEGHTPQAMQNALRALNERYRRHYSNR